MLGKFPSAVEKSESNRGNTIPGTTLEAYRSCVYTRLIPARTGGTRASTRLESSSRRYCPEIQHYSMGCSEVGSWTGGAAGGGEERRYQGDSRR